MDPLNLLQFSLYSKVMTEGMNLFDKNIDNGFISKNTFMYILICICITKLIPYNVYNYIENKLEKFLQENSDECAIIIPYHIKTYSCNMMGTKTISKTIYSDRFLALNHYLKNIKEVTSFIEIMNFENTRYGDDYKSDYILLPNNTQKIEICNKQNIYFEIVIETTKEEDTNDNKKKETKTNRIQTKNYIYKISKKGKQNIDILNDFMKTCVDRYIADNSEKKVQMLYEYIKSSRDDEDKLCMTFEGRPFTSNKTFNNIFFKGKDEIQKDIQEFVMNMDETKKNEISSEYARKGIPFKRTYLLYGPPGTGKSSLIKAFVNETGRHCILVEWSKIKTSSDFASLFHTIKINSQKILQKEIILVFEDFDANNSSAIKIRDNLKKPLPIQLPYIEGNPENLENLENLKNPENLENLENLEKPEKSEKTENIIKKTLEAMFATQTAKPCEDSLTLESVLNTLDGMKELYDAVIVFTTNDLASIDPAVIRPGRVDKLIKMDYVHSNIVKEIVKHYYNTEDSVDQLDAITSSISPAMVQSICIKNIFLASCIEELLQYTKG